MKENTVDLVIRMALISVAVVLLFMVVGSRQHGMLMDPVNRSSMWRKGYDTPANYEDNQLFCGGRSVSWNVFV
jgi:multisubunit Na+/H+ antiporter MnhC subunit